MGAQGEDDSDGKPVDFDLAGEDETGDIVEDDAEMLDLTVLDADAHRWWR